MVYILVFSIGIIIGMGLVPIVNKVRLNNKYTQGYNNALDDILNHGYWREQGGNGIEHYGCWYDDPSERDFNWRR